MTIEQLLNKLIEKGWRPFNKDIKEFFTMNEFTCGYRGEGTNHLGTIRAIVSKESGLWQFVCENKLVPIMCTKEWIKHYYEDIDDDNLISGENIQPTTEYEYRLIESALKDESELEDFLLSNIKVDG